VRAHRFRHQPVLGTEVEVSVQGTTGWRAARIDRRVLAEIERLEQVLSAYRPGSELERFKRGEVARVSAELSAVLALALEWPQRSAGTFTTSSGVLTALWQEAARLGQPPSTDALADAVDRAASPGYALIDGVAVRSGDCTGLNLNAFAKGWIVDRALGLERLRSRSTTVAVNAGGDLACAGPQPTLVSIENPLRPYDNEPPITRIALRDAAIATSGRSRRGVRVGSTWYSHIIDPRTALPVDHTASISVVAPDAATADVVATIAGVLAPQDAVERVTELGFAAFVVSPNGGVLSNEAWAALEQRVPAAGAP